MKSKIRYEIGVDEAGRGPLAGPVAVGVVAVPAGFNWNYIPGVGDSKKVSEKKRAVIAQQARVLQQSGIISFHVALIPHTTIDTIGITRAVERGIQKCFSKLNLNPLHTQVKLDGLLSAPEKFIHQETIIKGDAKEKVIGLASILAKVARDAYMVRGAKKYPLYGFEIHKGYGTALHRARIEKYGLSSLHRRSFCKKLLG